MGSVTVPEVAAVINTADADLRTEITTGPDLRSSTGLSGERDIY